MIQLADRQVKIAQISPFLKKLGCRPPPPPPSLPGTPMLPKVVVPRITTLNWGRGDDEACSVNVHQLCSFGCKLLSKVMSKTLVSSCNHKTNLKSICSDHHNGLSILNDHTKSIIKSGFETFTTERIHQINELEYIN